jgi:hypothetical protein
MMIGVAISQGLQFYVATNFQSMPGKSPRIHLRGTLVMGELAERKGY